jgi:DNA-binding CsgD family transcriptional regulator
MNSMKDQFVRDRSNDDFLCWHYTCRKYELNPREIEVIQHYISGLTAKEIAKKLYISVNTVYTHINNVYSKCEITKRVELISLFNYYKTKLKEVLLTDFRNKEKIDKILNTDWRIDSSINISY